MLSFPDAADVFFLANINSGKESRSSEDEEESSEYTVGFFDVVGGGI